MKSLSIHETPFTPYVLFESEKGELVSKGKSLPDDANTFYNPIIQWVEEYAVKPQPKTIVNIHFAYFNTVSSKNILEIFKKISQIKVAGFDVEIHWIYESEEEDMLEAGRDYESILKLPFNFVPINH